MDSKLFSRFTESMTQTNEIINDAHALSAIQTKEDDDILDIVRERLKKTR
ncbi:hypothetical protein ABLB69_14340 [Xenorhabdus khoisanae]|nr:hypothetical protein [Xenorhabdus khoisanae]